MDDIELRPIVEALLFVATEPLSLDRVCELLDGVERSRVVTALDDLRDAYRRQNHGLAIVEVGGGYEMVTVAEAAPWIRKLAATKTASRLSKPALETLAIIAYKQPLTRPEIEAIRGVDVAGVVKTLMDRRLVKIIGRKDVVGRPMMFGTTKEFLQAFGLNDLSDLPTLRDFTELARASDSSIDASSETASDASSDLDVELVDTGETAVVAGDEVSPLPETPA
jgi:segregation and condensation protein B